MIEGTFHHQPHADGYNFIALVPDLRRGGDELHHRHGSKGRLLTEDEYRALVAEGKDADYQVGHDDGYEEGRRDGFEEGYAAGRADEFSGEKG